MNQKTQSVSLCASLALVLVSFGAGAQEVRRIAPNDQVREIRIPTDQENLEVNEDPVLLYPRGGKPGGATPSGICGDGKLDVPLGEECDDGNADDRDGCSKDCKFEVCGDGVVNNKGTETCDDGNTADGDGCSGKCQAESASKPIVTFIRPFRPLPIILFPFHLGAKYMVDRVGGPQGAQKIVECSNDIRSSFVVGKIEVRHDATIDSKGIPRGVMHQLVSITCIDPFNSRSPVRLEVKAGGEGGTLAESSADEGKALIGWEMKNSWWNGMSLVTEMVPFQRTVAPNIEEHEKTWTGDHFGMGDALVKRFPVFCPQGYVMTGVTAAAGGYLDAAGIICRQVLGEEAARSFHKEHPKGSDIPLAGYEFGPIAQVHGGYRGAPFRAECNAAADFISGLDIYHGGVIDGISAYCQPTPASWDPAPAEYLSGKFGGAGGALGSTRAPAGYAMVGWASKASHPCSGGGLFDAPTGSCEGSLYEMTVSEFIPHYWPHSGIPAKVYSGENFGEGSGWFDWQNHDCPSGLFLAGLKGRADGYVRALGGICKPPATRGELIFPVEEP